MYYSNHHETTELGTCLEGERMLKLFHRALGVALLPQVSVANPMGIPYQKHRGSSLRGVHLYATAKRQDNIRGKYVCVDA